MGYRFLPQYFKIIDWALKSDRAAAVVTATTQPDSRFDTLQASDFAREYIWPNAFCPSPISLVQIAKDATKGHFNLDSVEDHAHRTYPLAVQSVLYLPFKQTTPARCASGATASSVTGTRTSSSTSSRRSHS